MDLDGFTTHICSKIGETDSTSRSLCAGYVQRRYQMLYDRYPWRDSLTTVAAASVASQTSVDLPAGIDRVVSIRYGGDHFLDPIDDNFLVQADPTIFERIGIPLYYREYTDSADNSKKIQLYPTPSTDGALLIVGKRTAPPLVIGTDVPILRNIDNCLLAYAHYDMLHRMRQYGKAQVILDEATKLYAEAEALEKAQTNVPRGTKKLSVQGNTLAEMTDSVCARIGDYLPPTQILVKEYLREEYRMIYDSHLWPESLVPIRADSDGSQLILPDFIDRIIAVRAETGGFQIGNEDICSYFAITPQIFEQTTGPAVGYSLLTPVGVYVLPSIQERLSFTSSDPMDNAMVFVRGEASGQIYEESVQLNGSAQVYTVRAYDVPLTVAKPETHGDITVRGAFSNAPMQTLYADQTERKHMRIWIQPTKSTAHNCLILGKRRISSLVGDSDTPMIRGLHNVLINAAVACMSKDPATSQKYGAKAEAALKTLIDGETNQQSRSPRVVPYVEPDYLWIGDSEGWFLAKG